MTVKLLNSIICLKRFYTEYVNLITKAEIITQKKIDPFIKDSIVKIEACYDDDAMISPNPILNKMPTARVF